MKTNIVLSHFQELRPSIIMPQAESLTLLAKAHSETSPAAEVLVKRFAVKPSQISQRGLESLDMSFKVRSIQERTKFFGVTANQVLKKFYADASTPPSHLVHVTCTGYISPSPAQHLVQTKNWVKSTRVTHAYHMGCYASIPAIRMAEGFVNSGEDKIDIVHTEMCSLHLDTKTNTPEQLVVQSLFADGYIKYSAVSERDAKSGLKVEAILERIIPDSEQDMSWQPADWGMQMTLSREVPAKIGAKLREFVTELCKEASLDLADVLKNATFAVHPGGPKIIDSVQTILELRPDQIEESKNVLLKYGNMSSATLPHVWKNILEKGKSGQIVMSLAFGPGLTIFGTAFKII